MASTVIGGSPAAGITGSGVFVPKNAYSTLTKLRRYLSLASENTKDDDHLRGFLFNASRAIDRYCHRSFFPRKDTLRFNLPEAEMIRIDEDMLEVIGLSHVNGASEVDSSVYWLKSGDDWNKTPYDRIELDDSSGSRLHFTGTPQRAIVASLVLGYHSDYNNAWVNSGASLTSSITATAQRINISGSNGQDTTGRAPRFEEGQLWKIGDEYVLAASGISTSGVDLIRGVNGTVAASHAASATVSVFQHMDDIEFATRRLAAMEYHQSHAPYTGRTIAINFGAVIESQDEWPQDVKGRIDRYRKHRIYAI
jgi:hypothetical protein